MKTARCLSLAALFCGAVLCFGCAARSYATLSPEESAAYDPLAPPRAIRLLTINAWSGLTYEGIFTMGRYKDDPEKRFQALVKGIQRIQPDIVAIQEANPLPHYAERLAEALPDYRSTFRVALGGIRCGPVGIPTNLREGGIILVRKPATLADLDRKVLASGGLVTNWCCFQLGETTQAILARTVLNGKPLQVYAVHLHSAPFHGATLDAALERLAQEGTADQVREAREELEEHLAQRRQEIDALKDFIAETCPAGMPAVILGDFNTAPHSGELDPLLAGGSWVDTYGRANPQSRGTTWDPLTNPNAQKPCGSLVPYERLCAYHDAHPHRIDLILVNTAIPSESILSSRVVLTGEDGLPPSDHHGVLTTLRW